VQRVEELALEAPFELGIVEIARVKIKGIRVHGHRRVFELEGDFHALALGACGEVKQGMLVETQLREHTIEASIRSVGHARILAEGRKN
jgi:hypothetical protein